MAVYRDQLDEIERDRDRRHDRAASRRRPRVSKCRAGCSPPPKRRRGVSRRRAGAQQRRRRIAAVAALVLIPFSPALFICARLARTCRASRMSARLAQPQDRSIAISSRGSRRIWRRIPNDGRGWEVIAPVYMRLGRYRRCRARAPKCAALSRRNCGAARRSRRSAGDAGERRRDRRREDRVRERVGARRDRSARAVLSWRLAAEQDGRRRCGARSGGR